jgi:hypothetical protein
MHQARTASAVKTGRSRPAYNAWVLVVRNEALLLPMVLFVGALLTRLLWINVPINIDETAWLRRGAAFLIALMDGRLGDTFLRHHPGVTNMWVIGGGLGLHFLLRGLGHPDALMLGSPDLLSYLDRLASGAPVPLEAYISARVISGLVTACCLIGIYILARKLFGRSVALIAILILLFEPFFLAYQRSITTDANQTNFLWLALLAFLLYVRAAIDSKTRSFGWLCASGVFYGLSALSKVPSLLTLPVFGAVGIWLAWRYRADRGWLKVAADLALWAATALLTILALWPALWVDLPGTVTRMYGGLTAEVASHSQFFLGHPTDAPGLGFYPVILAARLSPLLLLGAALGLVALAVPHLRHRLPGRFELLPILMTVVVILAFITFFGAKQDRYIVPLMPGLALLAAAGLWAAVTAWRERPAALRGKIGQPALQSRRLLAAAVLGVVAVQLAVLLPSMPYYLTYFSPLVGGPVVAQRLLMVGNGELLDRAAEWLNEHGGADKVAGLSGYGPSFQPYFLGSVAYEDARISASDPWPLQDADYVVLYSSQIQRHVPGHLADYFVPQQPLHTVRANGIDYARIYRGPAVRPDDIEGLANRTELDFGGKATLLGYELITPEVEAGGAAELTLYWQPLQPFPAPDYGVRLGLRGENGRYYGELFQAPVGSLLPVDEWREGQVVRDVHQIQVLPGTPPGEYGVEVALYSPQMGDTLEIRDEHGSYGFAVPLGVLRVTRPQQPTG